MSAGWLRDLRRWWPLAAVGLAVGLVVGLLVAFSPPQAAAEATIAFAPGADGTPDTVRLVLPAYAELARQDPDAPVLADVRPDTALLQVEARDDMASDALTTVQEAVDRVVQRAAGDPLVDTFVLAAPHSSGSVGGLGVTAIIAATMLGAVLAFAAVAAATALRPRVTLAVMQDLTIPVVPVHRRVRPGDSVEETLADPLARSAARRVAEVIGTRSAPEGIVVVGGGRSPITGRSVARLCEAALCGCSPDADRHGSAPRPRGATREVVTVASPGHGGDALVDLLAASTVVYAVDGDQSSAAVLDDLNVLEHLGVPVAAVVAVDVPEKGWR